MVNLVHSITPRRDTIDSAFYPTVPPISLELTNNCNLKCPYCANIVLTRPKTYIEWPLLERIVNECAERGYNLAWLHGVGEPLLWDRLEDVIALIKRKRAGAGSFATNGTLLSPDRVRSLLSAGLDSIYVSIDTLDPAIYKATRGGKLAKVIRNIQDMITLVPPTFQVTIALMDHKDQHITKATIQNFQETFGLHKNVILGLVQNQLFPGAPADYRANVEKIDGCHEPNGYLFIALDGRAGICCKDQNIGHSLGNVAERSIHDVWFDPITQTTFRNVALGIFDCPDVCTKKCVLKEPKQQATPVAKGFELPFGEAWQFADALVGAGEWQDAYENYAALAIRDPKNPFVQDMLRTIKQQMENGSNAV
ncbi:MAG: radical SAM/SPASM domain-containing protein [Rhodospirillaceae bacterium]|nr:radical SAM/SPASM domain-containing protein [Rhodospirillaceae bacterium]